MADCGHELEFGYFLIPNHANLGGTLELAHSLDRLGDDLISIQGHPYQRNHFDTFALIAVTLAQTEGVGSSRMLPTPRSAATDPAIEDSLQP